MTTPILLTDELGIGNEVQLRHLLSIIFTDEPDYVDRVFANIIAADPNFQQIKSINDVIKVLKVSFKNSINWGGYIPQMDGKHFQQLVDFETNALNSTLTYTKEAKPRENCVFWPDPTHPTKPASRFSSTPYVQKHPLISKNTPIGSAGSCFAIEIARALQEKEFNYIVTERADDPESGVYVDGYTAGDQYAPGSFSSGLQFNTGNFRHLAERAYDEVSFERLLIEYKSEYGEILYMDPYRENVYFTSQQAYLADYENHRKAVRDALNTCEVFILTPGLNECWQFYDGTYMARNPRKGTHPYVKHKVLSVAENVENLEVFYHTVRKHNPNMKLILSLSPVPFLATGRGYTHHVIEANCHSKAVLRVAIEEVVKNNEDVFYLPSYEFVSFCQKEPWMEDDRHVQRDTVRQIVDMFSEMFFI